jgi:hypothetical protein
LRWQEVFSGAERALIGRAGGVSDTTAVLRDFWRETPAERRSVLLPFIWGTVAPQGQIFGNRGRGSEAGILNTFRFSYPGYNELFTGAFDPRINSNSFGPNPNVTVFEWLAQKPGYRGRVAAVATWGVFDAIFNRERSGISVMAGWKPPFPSAASERQVLLNELYRTTIRLWGDNAFDALMHQVLLEYVRTAQPRLLFVGYGETDEWAHAGRYDLTLRSARHVDDFIGELWRVMQDMPQYRGATTFLITTDHGRGDAPDGWRNHGAGVAGAEHIWLAAIGPDTDAVGEILGGAPVTQAQVAATIAALLGEDWRAFSPGAAPAIAAVLGRGRR